MRLFLLGKNYLHIFSQIEPLRASDAYTNTMSKVKIVFAGGGSGGHVSPNLALISSIKSAAFDTEIHYIGTNGIESKLITTDIALFHTISAQKLDRSWKNIHKTLLLPFSVSKSVYQSKQILMSIKPDVLFSKGGYAALPVVIAAKKLGVPVISHESDVTLGLANKVALHYSDIFLSTFDINNIKITTVGSPINPVIYNGSAKKAYALTNLSKDKPVLLVLGGSLGADALNRFVLQNIARLTKKYAVILVTGKGKKVPLSSTPDFFQIEYTNQLADLYAITSLCLTRAGSNTLCELAVLGIPFIAVPLGGVSRGEQYGNAKRISAMTGGVILPQTELNYENFVRCVTSAKAKPCPTLDGTQKIVKIILDTANKSKY
jgi:UDP-N-acetylglucosamine--N-acetylmuramyl-(pentapeptide) pyrophosphoryl-undecaprenol N-acetylglucosamine transferase